MLDKENVWNYLQNMNFRQIFNKFERHLVYEEYFLKYPLPQLYWHQLNENFLLVMSLHFPINIFFVLNCIIRISLQFLKLTLVVYILRHLRVLLRRQNWRNLLRLLWLQLLLQFHRQQQGFLRHKARYGEFKNSCHVVKQAKLTLYDSRSSFWSPGNWDSFLWVLIQCMLCCCTLTFWFYI